ncbi:outer membrane beta-barrel protein [Spirosoma sp. HMF4905]|uniref:Outer membrane beta-barrel protein n=1 Tax=Spirosoma arboris TaxID=2682092 RepID=A0A7K1SC26_9BACT|nr:outer membrane beta-barrel protein [Spirosoma arboris]MVM31321.1 outer membrane beta-barrel protein [Spirosoma arboris]
MNTFKHLLTTAMIAASIASFAQSTTITVTTDSTSTTRVTRTRNYARVTSDFGIYVGLNNFGGSLPASYELSPIGSRFVALSWQKRIPIAVNGATKLRLITGPEVAWNNFMFEDRNTLVLQNGQVAIEPANVDLHRSKLVTTQLNLPLMVNLSFKSGFNWSLGAYAGMRLDSYTKVKPEGGASVRNHNSYNLNPIRWGLTTELGFRGTSKLFFRYEPNSPFRAGQGPDTSVWAVGIKL